jgi:hypothetical protein
MLEIVDIESLLFTGGLFFLLWAYFFFLRFLWDRERRKGNIGQSVKLKKTIDSCWKYNIFVSIALILIAISEQVNMNFNVDINTLYLVGIAFLAFPLLDWYTTNMAISKLGATEANPIMNFLISKLGLKNILFITVPIVSTVSISLILKGFIPLSFLVFVLVYSAVIINNVIVIRKKKALQRIRE